MSIPEAGDTLRIELLGRFRVSIGSRVIADDAWRLRKARSLIKLLALVPEHHLPREQVLEALWPDLDPLAATNNLHRTLYAIRSVFNPDRDATPGAPYLRLRGETLALDPAGALWVDVAAFEVAAARARRAQEVEVYEAALALYGGDLLPEDPYEDWALGRREQLRALYLDVLMALAQIHEGRKNYSGAIEALERVVGGEQAHEAAHVGLMRLYATLGQRYQALRQYQMLRDALRRDLDVEPAPASRRLYQAILAGSFPAGDTPEQGGPERGEPDAPGARRAVTDGAPSRSRWGEGGALSGLTAALDSFVGREGELAEIRRMSRDTRLLTLTGAGGCGKTRLAWEAAARVRESYADGVWLVELAALADRRLVPQALAAVLGVAEQPDRSLVEVIMEFLRAKQALVVLDNCEHLVAACASLLADLLPACPRLHVLATSRQPLGVGGERTWPVPSLSGPDPDCLPPLESLIEYDAVRLFVERAQAARPDFALTARNAPEVVRVCARLDGIPLAIELAAVWVKVLPVRGIAARLDDAFSLLTTGNETALPRQRTLRATMDWSYDLLDLAERTLWRRLSVFAGGWTLEAAEEVCAVDGLGRGEMLHVLARLVDKSLVLAEEQKAPEGQEEQMRYRLLETVRQYGAEKLAEADEEAATRRRHAAWFVALAERAEPELVGPHQVTWLDQLEREHDNLRAALRRTLEGGVVATGLRLAGSLWRFWYQRGYLSEGRRWLDEAVQVAHGDDCVETAAVRAKVLNGAGVLASDQGDYALSTVLQEESLALRRGIGDTHGVAASLNNLGVLARYQGQLDRAGQFFQESLTLRREVADRWGIAGSLANLSSVVAEQGDFARAIALQEESLALRRQLGDRVTTALSLTNLGVLARYRGQHERAVAFLNEGLALRLELGDKWGAANVYANLGNAVVDQGRYGQALSAYRQSLRLCQEIGDKRTVPYCLEGLASVSGAGGQFERAARLCAAAAGLRDALGSPLPSVEHAIYDRTIAAAHIALADEAFNVAWAAGQSLSLEQAIAEALAITIEDPIVPPASVPISDPQAQPSVPPAATLSPREREIVALIAAGHTNREIAVELGIAERTADTHVGNILKKLNLSSRAEAAAWAGANDRPVGSAE